MHKVNALRENNPTDASARSPDAVLRCGRYCVQFLRLPLPDLLHRGELELDLLFDRRGLLQPAPGPRGTLGHHRRMASIKWGQYLQGSPLLTTPHRVS